MFDFDFTNEANENLSQSFKDIKNDNGINNTNNDINLDSKNLILAKELSEKEIYEWKLLLKNNLLSNIEDDLASLKSGQEYTEINEINEESDNEYSEKKGIDEEDSENYLNLHLNKNEEKTTNDLNHEMQNNNEINNNTKFYQKDKNTNYLIDRNLYNKKYKDLIPEEKISFNEKDSLLFGGRLFKRYNRENKYKNKKNIKRIVYKCSHYRKNEKIKKDIKTKSFCLAKIIYIYPMKTLNLGIFLKKNILKNVMNFIIIKYK